MKILMITANDPAGVGIIFANAINRWTEHRCRLITLTTKYNFEFEADIHVPNICGSIPLDSKDGIQDVGCRRQETKGGGQRAVGWDARSAVSGQRSAVGGREDETSAACGLQSVALECPRISTGFPSLGCTDCEVARVSRDGRFDEIEYLLKTADVFHFHILSDENTRIGPFDLRDFIKGKEIVHHHHGHPHFRGNPEYYQEKYRQLGRKVFVSTPDLLKLLPQAHWIPNPVPMTDPAYMPAWETTSKAVVRRFRRKGWNVHIDEWAYEPAVVGSTGSVNAIGVAEGGWASSSCHNTWLNDDREAPSEITPQTHSSIRICQTPTRRDLKDTTLFLDVVREIKEEGIDAEAVLLENIPHRKCMALRRTCHICFDHMQGYYGMSSLEGLSQGLPVICGLDDWCAEHIKAFTGADDLPWVVARGKAELSSALRKLCLDAELRFAKGYEARRWLEKFWHEKAIVTRLCSVYESSSSSIGPTATHPEKETADDEVKTTIASIVNRWEHHEGAKALVEEITELRKPSFSINGSTYQFEFPNFVRRFVPGV